VGMDQQSRGELFSNRKRLRDNHCRRLPHGKRSIERPLHFLVIKNLGYLEVTKLPQ